MQGKNVLITGGAGFIGSNLARRLLDLGANVSIFLRSGETRRNIEDIQSKIKIIEGNLLDENDVKNAIEGVDYMYHFAWQTDLKESMKHPLEDLKVDMVGLVNILECCRKYNEDIKIIFASTVTVIGLTDKLPSNEDESEEPPSVYDIHKLMAEKYLQMYYNNHKIKSCVLRLSNIFGEGQKIDNPNRGVLNFMIGRALRGEELNVYGKGDFIRDYNYIQNYIDAFVLAAESENTNGEVYVMGSAQGREFNEVVEKIKEITEELTSKEVVIKHVPFPGEEHEINKRNFVADFGKFHRATGWEPKVRFDEGLKRTIEYYYRKV